MFSFIYYTKCKRCNEGQILKDRVYCDECLCDLESIRGLEEEEEEE